MRYALATLQTDQIFMYLVLTPHMFSCQKPACSSDHANMHLQTTRFTVGSAHLVLVGRLAAASQGGQPFSQPAWQQLADCLQHHRCLRTSAFQAAAGHEICSHCMYTVPCHSTSFGEGRLAPQLLELVASMARLQASSACKPSTVNASPLFGDSACALSLQSLSNPLCRLA